MKTATAATRYGQLIILTQLNLADTKLSNLNVKNPGLDKLLTERAAAGASYAGQLEWSATGLGRKARARHGLNCFTVAKPD